MTSILVLSAALFRRGHDGDPIARSVSAMALSLTMASPIAWEHHYGILLPVFAVLLRLLGKWPRLVLVAGATCHQQFLPGRQPAGWGINFAQSYLFFVVLVLLQTARRAGSSALALAALGRWRSAHIGPPARQNAKIRTHR